MMRLSNNMKLNFYGAVIMFLLTGFLGFAGNEKEDTRLVKNITKSFYKISKTDISNKYGKVIVNSWDKDSVKISVDITAYGKNDDVVQKLMDKVEIDFTKASDYLSIETDMNKKGGGFGSILSNIEGYSKTIFNKNKLTVDYTIFLPAGMELDLENKFGDVFIGDFNGKLDLDLSHGDLKAKNLLGNSTISISYGNGKIRELKSGFVKLKGGELEIEKGSEVSIESSASELELGNLKSLRISSRNDKIRINSLQVLNGTGDFTDIILMNLEKALNLNLEYGELFVERIGKDFDDIIINSELSDISLVISPESFFEANISGNEDRMIIPNSMLSLGKKVNTDTAYDFTLSGQVGYTRNKIGKVTIKSINADLIISIKEATILTKKNK